jgi:nitrogen fixation protein NifU and related proteins
MNDLYQDAIVAQAKAATRAGRLDPADASLTRDNPLCGDRVTIDVRLKDGRIADLAHRVRGCLLCEAAASAIGANAVGKTLADIENAEKGVHALLEGGCRAPDLWRELDNFLPVRDYASRHTCVLLPFETLRELLASVRRGGSS